MCDSLKQIAIKCPKLKRIIMNSIIVLKKISDLKQLFKLLKAFPSLKRLHINLMNKTDLQTNQWFSFELFNGFPQQLTHLYLCLCESPLNESILKDIDIYLPKLKYLEIRSPFTTDSRGMTQIIDILSRLSSLQTIRMRFSREVFYRPMEAMLIVKHTCFTPHMTHLTLSPIKPNPKLKCQQFTNPFVLNSQKSFVSHISGKFPKPELTFKRPNILNSHFS